MPFDGLVSNPYQVTSAASLAQNGTADLTFQSSGLAILEWVFCRVDGTVLTNSRYANIRLYRGQGNTSTAAIDMRFDQFFNLSTAEEEGGHTGLHHIYEANGTTFVYAAAFNVHFGFNQYCTLRFHNPNAEVASGGSPATTNLIHFAGLATAVTK